MELGPAPSEEEQILAYSFWENFKFAKELGMVLPVDHPKRVKIQQALDRLQERWDSLRENKLTSHS